MPVSGHRNLNYKAKCLPLQSLLIKERVFGFPRKRSQMGVTGTHGGVSGSQHYLCKICLCKFILALISYLQGSAELFLSCCRWKAYSEGAVYAPLSGSGKEGSPHLLSVESHLHLAKIVKCCHVASCPVTRKNEQHGQQRRSSTKESS